MAGLFAKLKARLSGANDEKRPDTTAEQPEEDLEAEPQEMAEPQGVTEAEQALLSSLSGLRIESSEDVKRSFLVMHVYAFASPFAREDIVNISKALRFLGFRIYTLAVEAEGKEQSLDSFLAYTRAILESEAEIEGCTLTGSYSAARVSCHIDPSGSVQITHDSSRPISLEPFEELFAPQDDLENTPVV